MSRNLYRRTPKVWWPPRSWDADTMNYSRPPPAPHPAFYRKLEPGPITASTLKIHRTCEQLIFIHCCNQSPQRLLLPPTTSNWLFSRTFSLRITSFYSIQRPSLSWYYSTTSCNLWRIPEYIFFKLFFVLSFDAFEEDFWCLSFSCGLRYVVLFVRDLLWSEEGSLRFTHSKLRSLAVFTAPKCGTFRFWWVLNLLILGSGSSLLWRSSLEKLGLRIGYWV